MNEPTPTAPYHSVPRGLFLLAIFYGGMVPLGGFLGAKQVALGPLAVEAGIFPLRPWRREQAATVWAPDRVGVQCRMEAPKRVRPKARRGLGPAGVARPRTHRA